MVSYIRSDLDFILAQIKIAEAHAAGQPLYGEGGLVPSYLLSYGLRTVDGSYNNLLPGQELWGAADQQFPEPLPLDFRPADGTFDPDGPNGPIPAISTNGTVYDPDGPGPSPALTMQNNYNPSNNPGSVLFDSSLRTISNLIVDQSLNNPAALMAALTYAGITGAEAVVARDLILGHYHAIESLEAAAAAAAAAVPGLLQTYNDAIAGIQGIIDADIAADATVLAYQNAIAAAPAAASAASGLQTAFGLFNTDTFNFFDGTPGLVDASDLAALANAILAADTAVTTTAAVLSAIAIDPGVTQADKDAASALADAAAQVQSDLVTLQTSLAVGQVVDITLFNAVQAVASVVSTVSSGASLIQSDLSDANSLGAAVAAAVLTQEARDDAEGGFADLLQAYNDGVALAATTAQDVIDNSADLNAALAANSVERLSDGSLVIPNVATDAGLSAPFNSWFTLFGQFFDHGLDLVNKGGSGTVYVPLQPDDPLYVEGSHTNFMVLTRATVKPGLDGIMGTDDDVRPVNTTTAFVDQNQTYTSHPSHQVFLRQYVLNGDGKPVATGHLIEGGGAQPGGMATWGEVKAQALLLGIKLVDQDVGKVPLLRTDAYGNFIPDPVTGGAQVIIGLGTDGIPNTADDITVSGVPTTDPDSPDVILLATATNGTLTGAFRTNSAFLADIAHTAVPTGIEDGDIEIGLANDPNQTVYDNELLDAHFIAGDGRVNENIGLTAVHSIFHSEHNRLAEHTKAVVLADAQKLLDGGASQTDAVAFLNEWLVNDVTAVPANLAAINPLDWDGNRLFQAAKFGTEMQYQHLVFEDFARKIQPNIDFFVVPDGYHADINPNIVAEFAHVVYRFGHSMLNETVDRVDAQFNDYSMGLIEAFLNPVAFDSNHTVADGIAAGDIIRGMTRQIGNGIDEFVTGALRNNLLGLPLDLATLNLARGRDTGVPSLNDTRREFYEVSNQAPELKPYESWVDFAANLKNEASIVNFIAAYGTHTSITSETTMDGKRDAAMALVFNQTFGTHTVPNDRNDFLNGTGIWANVETGLNIVDLWVGGLAEKTMVGGGMLGATFNFVFEVQMEKLQDGDRFYYLQRLDGLHLLAEMENNTFAKVILKNADAGHLPSDVFSTPGLILEVDRTKQFNAGLGETAGDDDILNDDINTAVDESADNLGNDPTGGSILTPLVIRDNPATPGTDSNYLKYTGDQHVLLGGTEANDTLIASEGDDTLYGDGGNDRLEGGQGNDSYIGGAGDDIITDLFGDDIIRSGSGNDAINAGVGTDLIIADEGNDFVVLGADILDEAFLGLGNDYLLGSKTTEQTLGGEGDDWIEIGAWTGAVGDNFDDQFTADSVKGHDVFRGDGGFDEFIGEGGDDIWIGTLGRGKFDGLSGFDWATYKDYQFGVDADLNRLPFNAGPLPPPNAELDTFTFVEGVSGSAFNDQITGTDSIDLSQVSEGGARGSVLDAQGIARISGLQDVLGAGVTSYGSGNILLGGAGSDLITGRGGNDIIDGDKYLNVRVGVFAGIGPDGGTGAEIASADSLKDLVTEVFNGTYNPGQFRIVREILTADGSGDIDTAVFSDMRANYTITSNDDGSLTVAHTNIANAALDDGVDIVRNIERLRFSDTTVDATTFSNSPTTGMLELNMTNGAINPLFNLAGRLELGDTLTVSLGSVADADVPLPALTDAAVSWQLGELDILTNITTWVDILDPTTNLPVTGLSLTLTEATGAAGLPVRAVWSFVDGAGNVTSATSPATAAVVAPDGLAPIVLDPVPVLAGTEDTTLTITRAQLAASVDANPAGEQIDFINLVVNPLEGAIQNIVVDGNGRFVSADFVPALNLNGGISINFDVIDAGGNTTAATVDVDLAPVNDAPVATPLTPLVTVHAGTPSVTFGLVELFGNAPTDNGQTIANGGRAIDVDRDGLDIVDGSVVLANPALGTLTDNNDNTWTFTPVAGSPPAIINIGINFQVDDGQGLPNSIVNGTSSINFVNEIPVLDLTGNQTSTTTTNFSENFGSNSYTDTDAGGPGTADDWTQDWTEIGDNPGSGSNLTINNGVLNFNDSVATGDSISRAVDLTGASSATLSFNWNENGADSGEDVQVQAYNGSTWDTLGTLAGVNFFNAGGNESYNLSASQIGSHSAIRFQSSGGLTAGENINIDNIVVAKNVTTTTPGAAGNDYATTYTENGAAVAIALSPSVTDLDDTQLVSATVRLTNAQLGDVLTTVGGLPGGIDAIPGPVVAGQITLTLVGPATLAQFQAAIGQVRFGNPADQNPIPGVRTIEVSVNDGVSISNIATATVTVNAV